jgi:hypothetical protein
VTVDGAGIPLDRWKCNTLSSATQEPEEAYPGVLSEGFDDSAWGNPVVSALTFDI